MKPYIFDRDRLIFLLSELSKNFFQLGRKMENEVRVRETGTLKKKGGGEK